MEKSEQIDKLAKGLTLFRKNLKQPFKDADNPFFKSKYVPLENVTEVIDKALDGTEITYVQVPINGESGTVGVATTILHTSGQWIEFPPFMLKPDKSNPQGYGSSITYARRYSLSSVFGITSDNDDDGNAASGHLNDSKGQRPPQKQQQTKPKQEPKPNQQQQEPPKSQHQLNIESFIKESYLFFKSHGITGQVYIDGLAHRLQVPQIYNAKQSDVMRVSQEWKAELQAQSEPVAATGGKWYDNK